MSSGWAPIEIGLETPQPTTNYAKPPTEQTQGPTGEELLITNTANLDETGKTDRRTRARYTLDLTEDTANQVLTADGEGTGKAIDMTAEDCTTQQGIMHTHHTKERSANNKALEVLTGNNLQEDDRRILTGRQTRAMTGRYGT